MAKDNKITFKMKSSQAQIVEGIPINSLSRPNECKNLFDLILKQHDQFSMILLVDRECIDEK